MANEPTVEEMERAGRAFGATLAQIYWALLDQQVDRHDATTIVAGFARGMAYVTRQDQSDS